MQKSVSFASTLLLLAFQPLNSTADQIGLHKHAQVFVTVVGFGHFPVSYRPVFAAINVLVTLPEWAKLLLIFGALLLAWLGLWIWLLRARVKSKTVELVAQNLRLEQEIAERKRIEVALQKARDELEQRVASRTGSLKETVDLLKVEIEEHKQTSKALRESESRLQSIFRAAPTGIGLVSNRILLEVNEQICEMTGYTSAELIGQSARILYPSDEEFEFVGQEKYDQIRQQGIGTVETRWQRQDGQIIEVLLSSAPLNPGNLAAGVTFTALDITERRKTEIALRRSEARYRALVEQANDAIFVTNTNDEIIDVNHRACELLGYERDELLTMKIPDIQAPEVRRELGTAIKYELTEHSGTAFETIDLHRDGGLIPVEVTSTKIAGQEQELVLSIVRDIRERKQVEVALLRRNQELDLLNRVITASAASQEQKTILETVCRELAQAFHLPQATASLLNETKTKVVVVAEYRVESQPSALSYTIPYQGNPITEYVIRQKAPVIIQDAQTDSRLALIQEHIQRRGIVSMLLLPIIIDGEVQGTIALDAIEPRDFSPDEVNLARSVTEQVAGALARARLHEKHRLLTAAIEQIDESVIITDKDDLIVYVNPTFERISGYSFNEVVGKSPNILGSGRLDEAFFQKMHAELKSGQVWHGRIINKKKDGTLFTEETTISPIRDQNDIIVNYVEVKRDVTQELEREKQYQQMQKMESIGRLTAGIAHDFNNLLTAINGFAELLHSRLPEDSPLREMTANITRSGQRATDLVSQLMAFSRRQIIEPKVVNLNTVIADLDIMLRRVISENIQLQVMLDPDLWPVKVDPAQTQQVIVNLAINARDAMPHGGRLTIETANVVLDQTYAANHIETKPGDYVMLAVSDSGLGMSQEVAARIFEPFYTTKETGKGTGLGLATVYGIVKQSGGDIQVYSEQGVGTTFKVYLPRVTGPPTPILPPEDEIQTLTGGETILVVEDDQIVRTLVFEVLRELGYKLLEAQGPQEALQLANEYPDPIHLLLTDVIMPEMSGKILAETMTQSRADLRVLFMSGYTDNAIAHHGVLNSGIDFIQKPLSQTALARKVRYVLDK